MRNYLMAVEIKIDPTFRASALWAFEDSAVKFPGLI
jgi:hypothetical protein